jgi:GAF domain-containing protein
VEPIAETRDALNRMAIKGDLAIGDQLARVNDRLSAQVPDIVAFSVGVVREGVTLTYVSTRMDAARLDAAQYVDDGPCQEAGRTGEVVSVDHDDLLDEGRWQLFAQAGAAAGIRSTLSLPVIHSSRVVGGVNLYGRTAKTFDGRHEELATMVGGWAEGAVTNADLSFATRLEATRAPRRLDDLETVRAAVSLLVSERGVSARMAETKLYEAAAQAGIPVVALAHMVIGESDGL